MEKVCKNEETIISVGFGENDMGMELCTLEDIEFAICCGCDCVEPNRIYEVQEGYLMVVYDEDTCDIDYLLVKR